MRSKTNGTPPRAVKIIANPLKRWARETARQVRRHLVAAGIRVVRKGAAVTVCIGGDGTILYANHKNRIQGAVLGIGGDRSFICQLTKRNWKKGILRILRKAGAEPRQTLEARCGATRYSAINDFVVHASDYRVIELDVRMAGKDHWFEADGIIVSTATGSHAYAYSAGGSRLPLSSRSIAVVPICPYMRLFRPSVLPKSGAVEIRSNRKCGFVVDGIFIRNVKAGEKITVRAGRPVRFLKKAVKA
jgi:NAD+ kinase